MISWVIASVVITILVAKDPGSRTVVPLYHDAVSHWLSGESLYQGPSGMNYFPHFALLFAPFHALGSPLGDIAWRWASAAVLLWGMWRMARVLFAADRSTAFSWIAILSLPLALPAIRNGQTNALLAGVLLHAAAALAMRRWWQGAVLLSLGIVVKPLGIVAALLAPVVYKQIRWRLIEAMLVVALLAAVVGTIDYILWMQGAAINNLRSCSVVIDNRFADFQGILRALGIEVDASIAVALRALAALAALGLWTFRSGRLDEATRALWLLTVVTAYLMLFNPMNESNSYVIIAPVMAAWGVRFISEAPSRTLGWVVIAMVLSMGLLKEPLRPLFGNQFALVWHPTMTIAFLVVTTRCIWLQTPPATAQLGTIACPTK